VVKPTALPAPPVRLATGNGDTRTGIDDAALPRAQRRTPDTGPPALSRRNDSVTYVIAEPCVDLKDKACIEECPVDCIYEGQRSLYIHPDECVDCGACEPVCPVEAIFYEDDTPEEWKDYYKANVEFFDELGSPGGASKLGLIERDHPVVAALPPQSHDE
jgi:NAD-dependent dihydropyrimidine dehydrogenase PreA subunit